MAIFSVPCLAFLVAYSVALTTPNISTTSAHVVDQELTTDLPLIQPPNQGNQAPAVQRNEVSLKGQPTATEFLSENSPCAQGFGRQMPYYPMAPPGPAGVPGPSGSAGIPGLPGASGAQGARGERGDRGEHGLSGAQGFKGDKGEPGIVGPPGLEGKSGFNGTVGEKGEPGQDYTPPDMSVFHVQRDANLLLTSGTQIITFDTEILNVGDDMSRHTGVFTCRIPGLYYFTFTMRSYAHGSYGLDIDLMVNNVEKTEMYMQAFSKDIMQTQSMILNLTKSDEVWLKANANTYIKGDAESNTFSGFLIKAM